MGVGTPSPWDLTSCGEGLRMYVWSYTSTVYISVWCLMTYSGNVTVTGDVR